LLLFLSWEQEVPGSNPGAPTELSDSLARHWLAGLFSVWEGRPQPSIPLEAFGVRKTAKPYALQMNTAQFPFGDGYGDPVNNEMSHLFHEGELRSVFAHQEKKMFEALESISAQQFHREDDAAITASLIEKFGIVPIELLEGQPTWQKGWENWPRFTPARMALGPCFAS
jgi:hypothetical protein